jgi:hypothetical protein
MIQGFIKVPIKLVRTDKITDVKEFFDVTSKILASEIIEYRPSNDDDFPTLDVTHITLKSGDTLQVYMKEEEFEQLLNTSLLFNLYDKELNSKQ